MEAVWKGLEPLMRRGTQGTFFKKMIYVHLFSDRSPKSAVLVFAVGELVPSFGTFWKPQISSY